VSVVADFLLFAGSMFACFVCYLVLRKLKVVANLDILRKETFDNLSEGVVELEVAAINAIDQIKSVEADLDLQLRNAEEMFARLNTLSSGEMGHLRAGMSGGSFSDTANFVSDRVRS